MKVLFINTDNDKFEQAHPSAGLLAILQPALLYNYYHEMLREGRILYDKLYNCCG